MYCVVSLAYIKAYSILSLLLVRAVHGLAAALVIPVANAYVGDVAPAEREGSYSGYFLVCFMAGFATGPALGGWIHDHFGIVWCFFSLGLLAGVSFGLTTGFVPELGIHRARINSSREYLRLITNPKVIALFTFILVSAIGRGSIMCFLPLLAKDKLGISASGLGTIITVNLLLAAALQALFGPLADRWSRKRILVGGTLLTGVMFAAVPYTTGFLPLMAVNILMGVGSAMAFPSSQAMALSLGRGMGMGAMVSLIHVGTSSGFTLGPILVGVIYKFFGIDLVFWVCSGILLLAACYGSLYLRDEDSPNKIPSNFLVESKGKPC
jgi:MFS family permease